MPVLDHIDVFHVSMPLLQPFRTAFGGDETAMESVLVRIESGDSIGWGEACPWRNPHYSAEYAAGAFRLISNHLAPLLLGHDITSGDDLQARLAAVKGNYFAKAALDTAWWDLHARCIGEPLWKVLGGTAPDVSVGADFGVQDSHAALFEKIQGALAAGYARIKLKYRPGWDLGMIAAVREQFPDAVFHVDCNSAYTLADAEDLRALDQYHLAMIEQPLSHDDLLDHATLQAQLTTPICLDESITSPAKARKAIACRAARWVNIKIGRTGGLTNARAIHDLCAASDIPCWVGGMLESAVGQAHSLALATLANIHYPSDIFPSDRFYAEDLSAPAIALSAPSTVTASAEPGIGVAPDPERLKRATLAGVCIG